MSWLAVDSPEVALIRERVPEFEHAFQAELEAEEGELGPFQAFSLFASWVLDRLRTAPDDDDAAQRAFSAVEELFRESDFPMGDSLGVEFVEVTWSESAAVCLMGPLTALRAGPAS